MKVSSRLFIVVLMKHEAKDGYVHLKQVVENITKNYDVKV